MRRTALELPALRAAREPRWTLAELAGRLVELSGARANASLSLAFTLVCDAQRRGEPVAWVGDRSSCFFAPDVAASGVELERLVVVRPPRASDVPIAAEWLARSGAFGLIVVDLGVHAQVPMPLQSRWLVQAQKHDLALLCLTEKTRAEQSLSSLVSLRAEATLRRVAPQTFECELVVLKDKRRSQAWRHVEVRRGTPGLR